MSPHPEKASPPMDVRWRSSSAVNASSLQPVNVLDGMMVNLEMSGRLLSDEHPLKKGAAADVGQRMRKGLPVLRAVVGDAYQRCATGELARACDVFESGRQDNVGDGTRAVAYLHAEGDDVGRQHHARHRLVAPERRADAGDPVLLRSVGGIDRERKVHVGDAVPEYARTTEGDACGADGLERERRSRDDVRDRLVIHHHPVFVRQAVRIHGGTCEHPRKNTRARV